MPRKSSMLLSLLNLVLKPVSGQTSAPSNPLIALPHYPPAQDREAWRTYWRAQGQPWRTEPEIDKKRQEYLAGRRSISPDIEHGIYPFKDIKLNRADVEWLLATHENGRGPVDWSDESQRVRQGLDLRGADLCEEDLSYLPLARFRGGLTWDEWDETTKEQRVMAAVVMKRTIFQEAHLEGSELMKAHLEEAGFYKAYLKDADLSRAHLERAYFYKAHLEEANLTEANVEGAELSRAWLEGADLENVTLGDEKHRGPQLADVHWGDVNLAVVKWSQVKVKRLGDEYVARQRKHEGKEKDRTTRLLEYEIAVRANRQLATVLQSQGLNEDAARFSYRAQVLQRTVLWRQRALGEWFFSLLLALLVGYGYRMWRILAAYMIVVSSCALAYFILGVSYAPHLSLLQAFLESITAFHGRVFTELFMSDTPQVWITAFEAVAGLIIEGVFIAMLTQRFFGK